MASRGGVALRVRELTDAGFARFGRALARPERAEDGSGQGWTWWAENALLPSDGRPFAIGYLALEPVELRVDWAERHMRSAEAIFPLGGDCLVYVGPPEHADEPSRAPRLDRFEVFRVRAGDGVVLDRGVWHGAPLAIDRPLSAAVFLLKDTGSSDTTIVRFEDAPITVEL
ncbi:MAG: ureidoglycolate lyase [Actinomycetota bacterium]